MCSAKVAARTCAVLYRREDTEANATPTAESGATEDHSAANDADAEDSIAADDRSEDLSIASDPRVEDHDTTPGSEVATNCSSCSGHVARLVAGECRTSLASQWGA